MVCELAVLIAAYAFSPIDLIPDFVPVLRYLDELILPIAGAVRLIDPAVMAEHRATGLAGPQASWALRSLQQHGC
jgi:uncharacterized membrane protein YkvA (DUF1232 family)